MQSRFQKLYRDLKDRAVDKEAEFHLHSPVGRLRLVKLHYREEIGYVYLECWDESDQQRILAFSEEALASMVLELKSTEPRKQVGFRPAMTSDDDLSASSLHDIADTSSGDSSAPV